MLLWMRSEASQHVAERYVSDLFAALASSAGDARHSTVSLIRRSEKPGLDGNPCSRSCVQPP